MSSRMEVKGGDGDVVARRKTARSLKVWLRRQRDAQRLAAASGLACDQSAAVSSVSRSRFTREYMYLYM